MGSLFQQHSVGLGYLVSLDTALSYTESTLTRSIHATTIEPVPFFQPQQVRKFKKEPHEPRARRPPMLKVPQRAGDQPRRLVKAPAKEHFSIDKAAGQLARDSTQQDLAE